MMRRHLAVVFVALSACGLPDHKNPFDPGTPPALQVKTTLAGTVTLEASGSTAPLLSGVSVDIPGVPGVVTDGAGAWSMPNVPAGTWNVQFHRDGYDDGLLTGITVTLDQGQSTVAVPAIELRRSRGDLVGQVTLEGETSAAAVTIGLSGGAGATVTDAAGLYHLTGVPVGTYALTATKLGFVDGTLPAVTIEASRTTAATDLVLAARPGSLSGTVTVLGAADSSGVSVQAVGTTLSGSPWSGLTTTSASGAFLLSGVPAGSYNVAFTLTDHAPVATAAAVAPAADTALPAVNLSRETGAVTGTATLEGSSSSAGVQVALTSTTAGPGDPPAGAAITDAAGTWRIESLPVGPYNIAYSMPGYHGATGSVTVQAHAVAAVAPVQLTTTPGDIKGRVLLEGLSSGSLAGVTVRLQGGTLSTVTLADGAYDLAGVGPGAQTVIFEKSGFDAQQVQAIMAAGQTITLFDVRLAISRGNVSGVFTLPLAASSAGVVVTATGPGGATTAGVTDPAGAFTLTGLPVGTYALSARKDPEWQPASVTGVVVAASATTALPAPVALAPLATASVIGKAVLEVLGAVAGTSASLTGSDFRGVAVSRNTTSGATGAFSFAGLAAGSYQLTLSRADHDQPAPIGLSLSTAQAVDLGSLALAASRGGAGGSVTATGAASQAGTVVTVSGGPDPGSTVTDATGAWNVAGLRVGTGYTATFQRSAYGSVQSAAFAVAAKVTTAVPPATLALATTGSLAGTAAVERGVASGIAVTLAGTNVNGAAVAGATTTGSGGAWSITGLPQGTYALTFTKAGYDAQTLSGLSVGAGATAAPGVTLTVALGTVAGTATLSAGTVTGFSVGTDFSGVVVTLTGADVPVPAAVTDASGTYRFDGVPVSLTGASFTVTARKTWYTTQSTTVTAVANATTLAPAMTLPVAAGSLTGVATLTNVPGGGDGLASANVAISITGTAFNGTSFSAAALSGSSGTWSTGALPPGTYDLVASATGRTCAAYARATVGSGAATPAGTVLCLDALAPSGLVLGQPAVVAPQQTGYTPATSVVVPVLVQASDATSPGNLRGYQVAMGPAPDWTSAALVTGTPATLTFAGLATDARNVLWARPIDTAGNVGPGVSVEVVQDSRDPTQPTLTTARSVVDSTSATVAISGAEGDANFLRYELATSSIAATATCPVTTAGAFAATTANAALTLAANQKTCVWARAVDRAGRISPQGMLEVTSDLLPPVSPTIAPLFDPTLLTVHAEYVDFFVTAPATDAPAGGGTPWRNVAWVEVDTGSGFRSLCPQAACRASGAFDPCGCGCVDARLVCDAGVFKAVRVPLLDGTGNSVGIRAVDFAGNVGSGASQLVNTATSLLQVDVGTQSATNPRGRGRLVGYRYTDVFLRLRDLGDDGRPDAADVSCNIASLGSVTSRVAVLGPRAVVHGDGVQLVSVRRPGVDGLFCTAANDDVTTVLYTAAAGTPTVTTEVREVTGSINYARTRESAAWTEHQYNPSTFADLGSVVKVLGPNTLTGRLTAAGTLGQPASVMLYAVPSGLSVADLVEGGDCLLIATVFPRAYRAVCKAGGVGDASGVTTWVLPSTAIAASLSSDGLLLAWMEQDGPTGQPRFHLRSPGPDRLYATGDDPADVTRLVPGTMPYGADLGVEGNHVVATETSTGSGTYWLLHWSAGPDGVFDGSVSADDTVTRVLPSSVPRPSPSLLAGGLVTYGVYGANGNLADVLASDLSGYRWETIEAAGFQGLVSNGAGTLFFARGGVLTARLPNGSEQPSGLFTSNLAATGSSLLTVESSSALLRRASGSSWFGGAPITLFTGSPLKVDASGDWGLIMTNEGGTRYRVVDLSQATPTTALLPIIGGTIVGNNGSGVSATVAAYQCLSGGWSACVHQPGADGRLGTGDDLTMVLRRPSTGLVYGAFGLAVFGDKIAFGDENGNIMVAGAGPDGVFNTADDTETMLGPAASISAGNITVAGDFAAWLQIAPTSGIQVWVADLAKGTKRQVTDHYSMKEQLVIDPSGRLSWVDYVFPVASIFVSAP